MDSAHLCHLYVLMYVLLGIIIFVLPEPDDATILFKTLTKHAIIQLMCNKESALVEPTQPLFTSGKRMLKQCNFLAISLFDM